ncbi:MAG: TlpA disulfide reductase family protein [Chitinophagaceae bacterium]
MKIFKFIPIKNYNISLLFPFFFSFTPIQGQGSKSVYPKIQLLQTDIKQLAIGDIVPDIVFQNLHNYKTITAKVSDFKGKILILDFWATWCGSCVAAIPQLESLQKDFLDKIQIILVNSSEGKDTEASLISFFKKRTQNTPSTYPLPYLLEDIDIHKLFPRRFIPHYAWIKDNRLIALTDSKELTKDNLENAINNKSLQIRMKKDELDFSVDAPFLVNNNGGNDSMFLYRSIISGYIDGIGSITGNNGLPSKGANRLFFYNTSIANILQFGYYDELPENKNLWLFEGSKEDSSLLKTKIINKENEYKNLYCYELIIPTSPVQKIREYVKADINKFFNLEVHPSVKKINCYLIKLTSEDSLTIAAQEDPTTLNNNYYSFSSLGSFIRYLNTVFSTPFITEVSDDKKIKIIISKSITSEKLLITALSQIGWKISLEQKDLKVAVIKST